MSTQIIDFAQWFQTPAGRCLQDWERSQGDRAVADCFGYQALQIGALNLPLLRNSRVRHRWLAGLETPQAASAAEVSACMQAAGAASPHLFLEPTSLPVAENSLDLVILPHTLEASADAHATLREVARVLVPEGRVLIFGFNPLSLWGVQQWHHLFMDRLGLEGPPFIPDVDDFIGYHRLQDWLHLLNLDIDAGRFGCYRPGLHSQTWFDRLGWMEKAGDRWWPILGGVYFLQAVKRVRGVRMIQPRWKLAKLARGSMPVAQRRPAARRDMTP